MLGGIRVRLMLLLFQVLLMRRQLTTILWLDYRQQFHPDRHRRFLREQFLPLQLLPELLIFLIVL